MTKMESENESENDHFCKVKEGFDFSKMIHFWVHSHLILIFIFGKWDRKWNQKWAKNGPKMSTVNNPIFMSILGIIFKKGIKIENWKWTKNEPKMATVNDPIKPDKSVMRMLHLSSFSRLQRLERLVIEFLIQHSGSFPGYPYYHRIIKIITVRTQYVPFLLSFSSWLLIDLCTRSSIGWP